jgi:2-oxoglutarate ferredoxin oxidoreductase subunit beta
MRILVHGDGLRLKPELSRTYRNQETHDPLDMARARAIASITDEIPVGILYRDPSVPCYEDLRAGERPSTPALIETVLDEEFDKVTIWPEAATASPAAE